MTRDRRGFISLALLLVCLTLLWAAPSLAAKAGGGEEQPGIINLNMTLLIQAVNFLILIALLQRFLYKPLTQYLAKRADGIRHSLEEAKTAREAAAKAQEEYEARIAATRRDAAAMREAAAREVEEERQRLLKASRDEAARLLTEAKGQIEQEVKRAKAELRAELVGLSVGISERLLGRSLTPDDQTRLADEVAREIGDGR